MPHVNVAFAGGKGRRPAYQFSPIGPAACGGMDFLSRRHHGAPGPASFVSVELFGLQPPGEEVGHLQAVSVVEGEVRIAVKPPIGQVYHCDIAAMAVDGLSPLECHAHGRAPVVLVRLGDGL